MKFKIVGYDENQEKPPPDLEACKVEYWFTRGVRWTATLVDKDGNQVGDAIFAYHKKDVAKLKKEDFVVAKELGSN
jgi:hypothetical protein